MSDLLAYQQAMRWLRRREYSCVELSVRLSQKGFADADINTVIGNLIQEGCLDEIRFVSQLVQTMQSKLKGPVWLDYELKQHQLSHIDIKPILKEYGINWPQQAKKLLEKKKLSVDNKATCYQCLRNKGYNDSIINAVIDDLKHSGDIYENR